MTREIQSWLLKYHAVKAALHSQIGAKNVMKMRRILRFKDSGQAKAPLVIITMTPASEVKVRTEAPVLSRRGRSLHRTKVAQNRLKLRKGEMKNSYLQGQGTGQDVELETNLTHCLGVLWERSEVCTTGAAGKQTHSKCVAFVFNKKRDGIIEVDQTEDGRDMQNIPITTQTTTSTRGAI